MLETTRHANATTLSLIVGPGLTSQQTKFTQQRACERGRPRLSLVVGRVAAGTMPAPESRANRERRAQQLPGTCG
jgi:hypothetical protein